PRTDDDAGESGAGVAQDLRAAEAAGRVAQVETHVRQLLVVGELHAELRVVDVLLGPGEIRARVERARDGGVEIGRQRRNRRRVDRFDRRGPHPAIGRVEDQHAQAILGLMHGGLRDDQLLFVGGDFRLRRQQIEWRRLADVDLCLVHARQFLGERKRRLARVDVRDGRHQVPVRALHGGGRVDEALAQPCAGDVAVDLAVLELLARRVDLEIAHERLRQRELQAGGDQRVVAREEAVAVRVHGVPGRGVRWAGPRQLVLEAGRRGDGVGLRRRRDQEARGRLNLVVAIHARRHRGPEYAGGRRDERVADLRVEAVGAQVRIVVERHPHRFVHGEAERGGGGWRLPVGGAREREDDERSGDGLGHDWYLNGLAFEESLLEIVEQRVRDGRHEQRQQQRQRLAAEHDEANRVVRPRPDPAGDDERNHPGDERERRHQNRTQAVAARLHDRVARGQARLLELVGVVDLQDGVLLHDAEEHQQAERREDVQRLPEDDDRQEREGQRQRQRQEDRDGMQPRLELRRQNQIHEDERERKRQNEVLRGASELLRA